MPLAYFDDCQISTRAADIYSRHKPDGSRYCLPIRQ